MLKLLHALVEPGLYAMTFKDGEMYVALVMDLEAEGAKIR